jgi:Family of unknown function (DUF5895)
MDTLLNLPTNDLLNEEFDFDQFDEDLLESGSIPYCQILNPPKGKKTSELKKRDFPFGFFIPLEQAEEVDFTPDENWVMTEILLSDAEDAEPTKGYLAKERVRMVVVHRAAKEVQSRADGSKPYRFLDLAWRNNEETQANQLAKVDKSIPSLYRVVNRTLVFFLGNGKNALHQSPLQVSMKGAFNVGFGIESREIYRAFDKAFLTAAKAKSNAKKGGKLSHKAHSRVILDFSLGCYKSEGREAFTCIEKVLVPSFDAIGSVKNADRDGRSVECTHVDFRLLSIAPSSPTAELIDQAWNDYGDFDKPNQGRSNESADEGNGQKNTIFFGVGRIDSEPQLDFTTDDPTARFKFTFDRNGLDVSQWCEATGDDAMAIADQWTIPGLKVSGRFGVDQTWSEGKPAVSVESIVFPNPEDKEDDLF